MGNNSVIGVDIRKKQYYDSVFLMGVNQKLSSTEGVNQTAVLMGSDKNKTLLENMGLCDQSIDEAGPNDLIIAVAGVREEAVDGALKMLDRILQGIDEQKLVSQYHTLEDGLAQLPDANLAIFSIPGDYIPHEAQKALDAGLNLFIFSSNVSVEEELRLKKEADEKGLLVMGPDCGTSLIGGIGIGFANVVRQGEIGVIGASGTGLQEFTTQVHNAGYGISHAIGTGSNDIKDAIGGITSFAALDALENDPNTKVIAFVSKPLDEKMITKLASRIAGCEKPVVCCFLGLESELQLLKKSDHVVRIIDEAVNESIGLLNTDFPKKLLALTHKEINWCEREQELWTAEQKYLRGVFAGGTFTYQSQQVLRDAGIRVFSNAPLDDAFNLLDPDDSQGHTIVDMGEEFYTLGRPHPMISGALRKDRIEREAKDREIAILFMDFILGFNASMDPAGELLDSIINAQKIVESRQGHLTVVASMCGTNQDPQDMSMQRELLEQQGVYVFNSNARAALFCANLIKLGKG